MITAIRNFIYGSTKSKNPKYTRVTVKSKKKETFSTLPNDIFQSFILPFCSSSDFYALIRLNRNTRRLMSDSTKYAVIYRFIGSKDQNSFFNEYSLSFSALSDLQIGLLFRRINIVFYGNQPLPEKLSWQIPRSIPSPKAVNRIWTNTDEEQVQTMPPLRRVTSKIDKDGAVLVGSTNKITWIAIKLVESSRISYVVLERDNKTKLWVVRKPRQEAFSPANYFPISGNVKLENRHFECLRGIAEGKNPLFRLAKVKDVRVEKEKEIKLRKAKQAE